MDILYSPELREWWPDSVKENRSSPRVIVRGTGAAFQAISISPPEAT